MSRATELGRALHVLTLTPFFPSDQNEVSGCFIAEPLAQLKQLGFDSSVIAATPIHHAKKSPAHWPQRNGCDIRKFPEISGSPVRGSCSTPASWGEYGSCTV